MSVTSRPGFIRAFQTQLYRHYDRNGVLLYIGATKNVFKRIEEHKYGSQWFPQIATITIEHFDTREDAQKAEALAITNENPLYNRSQGYREGVHNPGNLSDRSEQAAT